ncbi:hypothetical protein AF335_19720 [Streptomyces eurocidicus]|uniref:Uncharacterized protein n=1 Tax=Streptomyces eurocidicus TaxID=66423 RepID=A0A2N8NTA0_STREU|nr:hypothetical protein AF335_19720 [Streptomyces eurocidicus]
MGRSAVFSVRRTVPVRLRGRAPYTYSRPGAEVIQIMVSASVNRMDDAPPHGMIMQIVTGG